MSVSYTHLTNVDVNNRFVCYVIRELGKQLKKLGMLICLLYTSAAELQKVKSNLAAMLRQERTKEVRRDWER